MSAIDDLLRKRKILITSGTGGVGKTTLSAALAVRSCLMGRSTAVVTIDPAKRLAQSLGIEALGDLPKDLTPHLKSVIEKRGSPLTHPVGSFYAITPEVQRTFDRFVERVAPTLPLAQRIKDNPIFQMVAQEFSGANEYMAFQRLHELVEGGKYDFIVLDTPPHRNTLAFLEAPRLLGEFFEDRWFQWSIRSANRFFSGSFKKVLQTLENLTGAHFITHLLDFLSAILELRVGFNRKLDEMKKLFASSDVGFVLVTTPTPDTLGEFQHMMRRIKDLRFHFDGIFLNRSVGALDLSSPVPSSVPVPQWQRAMDVLRAMQARENQVEGALKRALLQWDFQSVDEAFFRIPELSRDIHCLEDLLHVALLFSQPLSQAHASHPNNLQGSHGSERRQ